MFFEMDDFFEFILGMAGIIVFGIVAMAAINAFRPRRKDTDKE